MPITPNNAPNIPALTRGKPAKIGTLTAINQAVQWSVPEPSRDHQGFMVIQVPTGATGTVTAILEVSLDGGVTWAGWPVGTQGTTGSSPLSGDTQASFTANYQIQGMAGAAFRFGFSGATTVTSADVYVLVG